LELPRLLITMGDINGVGPEILAKALARPEISSLCTPIVLGDPAAYASCAIYAPTAPPPISLRTLPELGDSNGGIPFLASDAVIPPYRPGTLDARAGAAAIAWVKEAVRLCLSGEADGVVTGPISKEGIHLAGFAYPGHTDLIAEMTGSPGYRMCLFTDTMRIVHISSHCSLREALDYVKTDRIAESIRIGHQSLVELDLPRKRIAVAGLNPHAGENGAFGREEIDEIAPAIVRCKHEGIDCSGPYPPDTLFGKMRDGEFDMVIAMYHDQGHIPLKLIAMDEGVNVTLGIPIVRTSVDHGTAYDIAGMGIAREHSLIAAVRHGARLARKRAHARVSS
jgi:4-hydroxythreonine-4-phosphate dehydrogenase